jgi:hypothetical protein
MARDYGAGRPPLIQGRPDIGPPHIHYYYILF